MRKFLSTLLQNISVPFGTSGESAPPPDLGTIAEHAEEAVEEAATLPSIDERLARLENAIEFLTEERGLENKFRTELSQYVDDLRAEIRQTMAARKIFGIIATLSGVSLLVVPGLLAYLAPTTFTILPDYPKSALIIGMIAGGVALLLTLTRSVYRSAHERQSDEFIPPQLKTIHDLLREGSR